MDSCAVKVDDFRAFDILYTPLGNAVAELRRRRGDAKLRARVADFHHALPPAFMPPMPCAVLSRQITSPNREFELFIATVKETGLPPLCIEQSQDVFCSRNRYKYRWCRPFFEVRLNQPRGLHLMQDSRFDGRKIADIRISNGMALTGFHHALLDLSFPNFQQNIRDYSDWYSSACHGEFFYLRYLALFICDGILFENFIFDDPEERRFTEERVMPSFEKAFEIFGVKPLIVSLAPLAIEAEERWHHHAGHLYYPAIKLVRGRR